MSTDSKSASLLSYFDAPEGFTATIGYLAGYSADEGFLREALNRYTQKSDAIRRNEGVIQLILMLDPGAQQISPDRVPGLLHLPVGSGSKKPFRLMHAKIALLGFRADEGEDYVFRVLVSTGNWTRDSLEFSIDLVWGFDFSLASGRGDPELFEQKRVDLTEVSAIFDWLLEVYDSRLPKTILPEWPNSQFRLLYQEFSKKLKIAKRGGSAQKPRIFHTRSKSLLEQLPEMIRTHAANVSRNYLAMGSGFYESTPSRSKVPVVIAEIIQVLKSERLLTQSSNVDVFVNPKACQGVAKTFPLMRAQGIEVRPNGVPSVFGRAAPRKLHAKFLFGANSNSSGSLSSSWIYLGSGNLTGPGFCGAAVSGVGNFEVGVVFSPGELHWSPPRRSGAKPVTEYLPIQSERVIDHINELSLGEEFVKREQEFFSPPIAYFLWVAGEGTDSGYLKVASAPFFEFEVLVNGKEFTSFPLEGVMTWLESRPLALRIQWKLGKRIHEATIPVIDEAGRVSSMAVPRIEIQDAWSQLVLFPLPPHQDDDEVSGDLEGGKLSSGLRRGAVLEAVESYPLRLMMEFIENIAEKQTEITKANWAYWCLRLRQTLIQASESSVLDHIRVLGLNPLQALRHPAFRPDYARDGLSNEGREYEEVLRQIEVLWRVADLAPILEVE